MEKSIKLNTLNSLIMCKICRGYLIDATTVRECLHTFCKSCLVRHLEIKNSCPTCQIIIHHSHPLKYISLDRTMQDIVLKIVPGLQLNEIKREKEFCRIRGLPYLKQVPAGIEVNDDNPAQDQLAANSDYHTTDELVNIELECIASHLKSFKKTKFLRVSSQATIIHLKKFIAVKCLGGLDKYEDIDILCNNQLLRKDHSLKFVYITWWRYKKSPLKLQYRPKFDL